jgi:hypothetical protein
MRGVMDFLGSLIYLPVSIIKERQEVKEFFAPFSSGLSDFFLSEGHSLILGGI